jgi:hypothetical protein
MTGAEVDEIIGRAVEPKRRAEWKRVEPPATRSVFNRSPSVFRFSGCERAKSGLFPDIPKSQIFGGRAS